MSDQLSEFIGLDIPKLQQETEEAKEKRLHIATKITKLTEYPEWAVFTEELKRLEDSLNHPCEVYMNNPNLAIYHSGQKESLRIIKNFVEKQVKIIEQYAKEQSQQGEGGSEGPTIREFTDDTIVPGI